MGDSGCGTGNYTVTFIKDYGARSIHCSDFSTSMLDQARKNVAVALNSTTLQPPTNGEVEVTYSSDNVSDMPDIPSEEFDLVVNNQVVHHLRPDNGFADLFGATKEWFRVLKPGGKLAINFTPSNVGFR